MSTTRLVVLGAVRVFQPVHGYLVRRELLRRQVYRWAQLNPGSVYGEGILQGVIVELGSDDVRYTLTDG